MNDDDRRLWVLNDEGLYRMWRASKMALRQWIRQNRDFIDTVTGNVTAGRRQAHYLVTARRRPVADYFYDFSKQNKTDGWPSVDVGLLKPVGEAGRGTAPSWADPDTRGAGRSIPTGGGHSPRPPGHATAVGRADPRPVARGSGVPAARRRRP